MSTLFENQAPHPLADLDTALAETFDQVFGESSVRPSEAA